MKIFNIIACIIILLLAIASAVFSYFLYEKRVQFVDGWQQMSTAIQNSSKTIDKQGTKKYAQELTVDKLSHKTYTQDGMQRQLKNLTTQSSDFVKQYENAMAGWKKMSEVLADNAAAREAILKQGDAAKKKLAQKELEFNNETFEEDDFNKKAAEFSKQNKALIDQYNDAMQGWAQLTKVLADNAKAREAILQQGSNASKKLAQGELNFTNADFDAVSLGKKINEFAKQNRILIKQYNDAMDGWKVLTEAIADNAKLRAGVSKDLIAESDKAAFEAKDLTVQKLAFDGKNFSIRELKKLIQRSEKQNKALVDQYNKLDREYKDLAKRYEDMTADRNKFKKAFEDTSKVLADTKAELAATQGQRDVMAKYFATISNRVNAKAGSDKDFINRNTYAGRLKLVSNAVDALIKNRDGMIKEMERISGKKLDSKAIFANVRNGLKPFEDQFNSHKVARQKYAGAISIIASNPQLKRTFKDDLSKNFTSPDAIVNANKVELAKIPVLQNQLAAAHRKIGNLNNDVSTRNGEIKKLNGIITDYRTILDLKPEDGHPKAWVRGSLDARKEVTGTVTKVSEKYGYVVLNIGEDTTVIQTIGNKKQPVNPDLESGLTFNVTRDGRFVSTVTLSNVGKKESTAHIPTDKAGSIKVGDKVTFKK